jgi:hypothetical protein
VEDTAERNVCDTTGEAIVHKVKSAKDDSYSRITYTRRRWATTQISGKEVIRKGTDEEIDDTIVAHNSG